MKKFFKYILPLLLMLSDSNVYSQKVQNVWVTGGGKALDFNAPSPSVRNMTPNTWGRHGSVCDENGKLILFSDGRTIWNKNQAVITGASNLISNSFTLIQGNGMIIKRPGYQNNYFVFSADSNNLYYSEVDLSLNSGSGGLVSSGNLLHNQYGIGMVAVFHQNCEDIWLVIKERNSSAYLSFLIDSSGILNNPIVSNVGSIPRYNFFVTAEMAASVKGNKIARVYPGSYTSLGKLEISQFNNLNGYLSNAIQLQNIYTSKNFLEFSSNGNVLYSNEGSGATGNPRLIQYDVSLSTSNAILNSKYIIDSTIAVWTNRSYHDLKLGLDDKIYIKIHGGTPTVGYHTDSILVIASPNVLGSGCGFNLNKFSYDSDNDFMPDMLSYAYQNIELGDTCRSDSTFFTVRDTSSYSSLNWNFGDTASGAWNTATGGSVYHTFSDSGKFVITFTGQRKTCSIADTLIDTIYIGAIPEADLGPDTILCSNDSILLKANTLATSYKWHNNSTFDSLFVSESGRYWVKVENVCGTDADTIDVIKDMITVDLGNDIEICSRDQVNKPLSAPNASAYVWSTGATTPNIQATQFGKYWVEVTSSYGCKGSDTLEIIPLNCTGIEENALSKINIYPNPNSGSFIVESDHELSELEVNITDLQGKTVYHQHFSSAKKVNCQFTATPGMYFVEIKMNNDLHRQRIVVQ